MTIKPLSCIKPCIVRSYGKTLNGLAFSGVDSSARKGHVRCHPGLGIGAFWERMPCVPFGSVGLTRTGRNADRSVKTTLHAATAANNAPFTQRTETMPAQLGSAGAPLQVNSAEVAQTCAAASRD